MRQPARKGPHHEWDNQEDRRTNPASSGVCFSNAPAFVDQCPKHHGFAPAPMGQLMPLASLSHTGSLSPNSASRTVPKPANILVRAQGRDYLYPLRGIAPPAGHHRPLRCECCRCADFQGTQLGTMYRLVEMDRAHPRIRRRVHSD